jgi:hypothetical protein
MGEQGDCMMNQYQITAEWIVTAEQKEKTEKWIHHPLARATDPLFGMGAHHHWLAFNRVGDWMNKICQLQAE